MVYLIYTLINAYHNNYIMYTNYVITVQIPIYKRNV